MHIMFGFVRFYLAVFVVFCHLSGSSQFSHVGGFSVFAFYMLSGYLMTLIMNTKYGYTWTGIRQYALNRGMKILPSYWVIALTTLSLIYFLNFPLIHEAIRLPLSAHEIFSNAFIVGLTPEKMSGGLQMARLVPPAWALHVEICFYVLIGLFLGRSKKIAVIWVALSAIYHVVALKNNLPRYSTVMAASLPFSVGTLIFHCRGDIDRFLPKSDLIAAALVAVYPIFIIGAGYLPFSVEHYPAYANIMMFALVLIYLSRVKVRSLKSADEWFGSLSYPIYLSHWLVGCIAAQMFSMDKSLTLFAVSLPVVILLSLILVRFIDHPVERFRTAVRPPLGAMPT